MDPNILNAWQATQSQISNQLNAFDSIKNSDTESTSDTIDNDRIADILAQVAAFSLESKQVEFVSKFYDMVPFLNGTQRYNQDELSHQVELLFQSTFPDIRSGLQHANQHVHNEQDCDLIIGGLDMTAIPQHIVDKATEVVSEGSRHPSSEQVHDWFDRDVLTQFRPVSAPDSTPVPGAATTMSDWSVVSLCVHRYRGASCEPLWSRDIVIRSAVPYQSGFLAFREAVPLMRVLLECYRESVTENKQCWPDVLVVDGNGRLHPQVCGLASHVGYMTGTPTVGVAKTLAHADGISRTLDKALRSCADSRYASVEGRWRGRDAVSGDASGDASGGSAADTSDTPVDPDVGFSALTTALLDRYYAGDAPCVDHEPVARVALPMTTVAEMQSLLAAPHTLLAAGSAQQLLPSPSYPLLARSSLPCRPTSPAAAAGEVLGLGVHAGLLHALQDAMRKARKRKPGVATEPTPAAALTGALASVTRTNPVYVSVGANVRLKVALLLVLATSPFRVPEPTRAADMSGRALVRHIEQVVNAKNK